MKLLRIKLPDSLHARLKVQAAQESERCDTRITLQSLSADLLREWSANLEPRINPNINVQVKGE